VKLLWVSEIGSEAGPSGFALLESIASRQAAHVVVARSMTEALELLAHENFVMVIVDASPKAPLLAGSIARVVSHHQPVVVVTNDSRVRFLAYSAGAIDCWSAPFDEEAVRSKVNAFVAMERSHEREVNRASRRTPEGDATCASDEFLATLSHELRTPLNAVLGWTQLLRSGVLDAAAQRHALDTVERNARNQAMLLSHLLDTSNLVTGRMNIERRAIVFEDVVLEAIEAARPIARSKGVLLHSRVEPTGAMEGDHDRLRQVASNLITNAIKFTPAGGNVSIALKRTGARAVLAVTDDGCGIDVRFLPHVFERFRRAEAVHVRNDRGLGLGLTIVKYVVEMHGGDVTVESAGKDSGATFTVRLPVANANTAETDQQTAQADDDETDDAWATLAGLDVLIVEDDPDGRELLELVLSRCGARVRTAANVGDAIDAIRESWPHVVVSDIGLPGEDGYSLVQKVRAMASSAGRDLPVIALTAYTTDRDRARALEAGFHAHASKPVDPAELTRAVASVVAGATAA
jgi:signal transduction histidine kinase/ActR/RegA family two-component response regulator